MRPPRIAITASLCPGEAAVAGGLPFDYLKRGYGRAVAGAGGAPFVVPNLDDAAAIDPLLEVADGLLLSGGSDLHPAAFGEEVLFPAPMQLERDRVELRAVRLALAAGLPVLAVCRGHQVAAVALGGALHQDLSLRPGTAEHRTRGGRPTFHRVLVEPWSLLARLLGVTDLVVNSTHHQLVREDRLPSGLAICGRAEDGAVEAIEAADGRFLVGVQWHPEALDDEPAARLFRGFVAAAAARRG